MKKNKNNNLNKNKNKNKTIFSKRIKIEKIKFNKNMYKKINKFSKCKNNIYRMKNNKNMILNNNIIMNNLDYKNINKKQMKKKSKNKYCGRTKNYKKNL